MGDDRDKRGRKSVHPGLREPSPGAEIDATRQATEARLRVSQSAPPPVPPRAPKRKRDTDSSSTIEMKVPTEPRIPVGHPVVSLVRRAEDGSLIFDQGTGRIPFWLEALINEHWAKEGRG